MKVIDQTMMITFTWIKHRAKKNSLYRKKLCIEPIGCYDVFSLLNYLCVCIYIFFWLTPCWFCFNTRLFFAVQKELPIIKFINRKSSIHELGLTKILLRNLNLTKKLYLEMRKIVFTRFHGKE